MNEKVFINDKGWIKIKLSHLIFPDKCCKCGESTTRKQPYKAETGFWWLLALIKIRFYLKIYIPLCESCYKEIYIEDPKVNKRGAIRGLIFGGIVGLAGIIVGVAYSVRHRVPRGESDIGVILGGILFFVGFILGPLIGYFFTGKTPRLPVEVSNYAPWDKTVEIKFGNDEYTRDVFTTILRKTDAE